MLLNLNSIVSIKLTAYGQTVNEAYKNRLHISYNAIVRAEPELPSLNLPSVVDDDGCQTWFLYQVLEIFGPYTTPHLPPCFEYIKVTEPVKPVTGKLCASCNSTGFAPSKMHGRCKFCDGTFGGNPPTDDEVAEWNATRF